MPTAFTDRRRGFSLVELLAAMFVILILAGISFQVIRMGLDASRTVRCVSSLRSLGGAITLYVGDNKGFFPPLVESFNPTYGLWMESISPYGADFEYGSNFSTEQKNSSCYYCPEVDENSPPRQWGCPDYGANDKILIRRSMQNGRTQGAESGIALTSSASIERPASTLLMADSAPKGHIDWGTWYLLGDSFINNWQDGGDVAQLDGLPALRHDSGQAFNALFVDGHVETVRYDDPRIRTPEDRRRFLGK